MAMITTYRPKKKGKKTRQGHGRGTKFGHKSGKLYVKKYRGQGGPKR